MEPNTPIIKAGEKVIFDVRSDVDKLIAEAKAEVLKIQVVNALPDPLTTDVNNTLYLVLNPELPNGNAYLEYLFVDHRWELIGCTDIDVRELEVQVRSLDVRVTNIEGHWPIWTVTDS